MGVATTHWWKMELVDVLHLAAEQHGVVSRRQLRHLDVSSSSLHRSRRRGELVDLAPGVLRVASHPPTFEMRCMAIQLATDPVGALSSWTAARLVGLRRMPESPIHVTVPTNTNRRLPSWVRLHRDSWTPTDRIVRPDGLIVVHPMRMLFGLAAAFNRYRFERAAEDAWHLGLITPEMADDCLERHRCRGKDGVSTFEAWLHRARNQRRPSQSELERTLLEALDRIGLPTPERQHPLVLSSGDTIHLDISWPDIRLAVEPGSSWWHGGDAGQRRDQRRDRACSELGWMIVRFDDTMRSDPAAAARQVLRIHRHRTADLRNLRDSSR